MIRVARGSFGIKRRCSRSKNFGIFSNGMLPHFLISHRFKYVANEQINANLNNKNINSTRFFLSLSQYVTLSNALYCSNRQYLIYNTIRISNEEFPR